MAGRGLLKKYMTLIHPVERDEVLEVSPVEEVSGTFI